MTTADSSYAVECPTCKARFAATGSFVGRRAKCASCGQVFVIPPPPPAAPPGFVDFEEQKAEKPQYVSVDCRVCGTRLTGRLDHVGRKIKCPDCGAGTVLPPPAPPKPKNIPAAMEGEQYELWDADDQPLPSELIAAQPKYIRVPCRLCGTVMHAAETQVGQPIVCPDCGSGNIVPPPPKKTGTHSVLTPDAVTPQIDLSEAVATRPMIVPRTVGLSLAEEETEAEIERAFQKAARTGRPSGRDARNRPIPPRFPLLTRILSFPFSEGSLSRLGALTMGLVACWFFFVDGLPSVAGWGGTGSGAVRAMGGLIECCFGAVGTLIWMALAASVIYAIIAQSAVGADKIDEWPSLTFYNTLGDMLPLALAIIFSAAPGYILSQLVFPDPSLAAPLVLGSLLLVFPFILLSQQAGTSTWEVINLQVLGAMIRCPVSMILFYIESVILITLCGVAMYGAMLVNRYLTIAVVPLVVTCMFLYARLIGRLGWRLSQKMSAEVPEEGPPPVTPKNYNPPRQPGRPT